MEQQQLCPQCQAPNTAGSQFCIHCGARLAPPGPQMPRPHAPAFQSPASYGPSSFLAVLRIDKLGARLDGWADLVEGAAEKTEAVQEAFQSELAGRGMPQVSLSWEEMTPGGLAVSRRRPYHLTSSHVGATVAAYIGQFGQDLYVTWDLYVRPVIKWRNIAIMAGVAAVLALFAAIDSRFGETRFNFGGWVFATLGWAIFIAVGAVILSRVLYGSNWAFFIEEIDTFAADDVTAMTFAVHKSLLNAIDAAGLASSLLRRKETFKGGRRERLI